MLMEKGDVRVIFNGHTESWTVLESKGNVIKPTSYLVKKEKRIRKIRNRVRRVIEGDPSDVCYESRCSSWFLG